MTVLGQQHPEWGQVMPDGKRKAAIAIGVAKPKSLPYLAGAINGARGFHDWATALGYESTLVTDEDSLVTMSRLRTELESILLKPGAPPINRLLIYFAGHGLIRNIEEGLWLLSDWRDEGRAVATEILRRRLYKYNVEQIAIFADACRKLPPNIEDADLTADGVLGLGPSPARANPAIDKFIAAQDGTATYMVPGSTPTEDRCVFSGVLLEGLWGTKTSAFSKARSDKITSQSLGTYLRSEVSQLANRYKFKLDPTVNWSFPEGDDIYFGDSSPAPVPPKFPDWPLPGTLIGMGTSPKPDIDFDFEVDDGQVSASFRGPGDNISEGLSPEFAKPARRGKRTRRAERAPPAQTAPDRSAPADALLHQIRNQPRPAGFETRSGFAVQGSTIKTVWSTPGIAAEPHGLGVWRIGRPEPHGSPISELRTAAAVLIEFSDGTFAAPTALPEFVATILTDKRGVAALVYRKIDAAQTDAQRAEKAIAEMESGAVRYDAAISFTVDLRQSKHADPVFGVVSAYLYDAIGDTDSIRRMAYYYTRYGQPIPYDIALLAQLDGRWKDGLLYADVPAVAERDPRSKDELQFSWTYSATPASSGVVGGFWPWMRQGWSFLEDFAADGSPLIKPELIALQKSLATARFTTMDDKGGPKLAALFELRPTPVV
jgi:hypothetical protein